MLSSVLALKQPTLGRLKQDGQMLQPQQLSESLSQNQVSFKGLSCASVVEGLPITLEALGSIPRMEIK
jgi:hypothetical protein